MLKTLIKSNEEKDIKIDLSMQLLNSNKEEEINAIIYNSNKDNIQELKEEVFKKIVPTFSQDLIIFASNSVFDTKYPEDLKTILSIYNSTEHRSLYHFLKILKNSKNIIYTFSNIIDPLMKGQEVDNKLFGKINSKSIYKKVIEQSCSEKIIENWISHFLKDDKYNILIFQIQSNICEHLNHIQFLYENIINRNNNKNKVIIFIIYLERVIKYLKNTNSKENINYISYISPYEQIFIDNLNGKDFNITNLIGLKNIDLYQNPLIYNFNEQFDKIIFPAFTTISYDIDNIFKNILFDNYYQYIVEKLINNNELKERIKNKILEFVGKETDIFLYSIFYNNFFEKFDVDFLSILIRNLNYKQKEYFIKFIVKTERDGVFPILLSPKSKVEEIVHLSEEYLKTLNVSSTFIKLKIKENYINSILGLNIPLINVSINKLYKNTEELQNNFYSLEDEFRNDYIDEIEEQNKAIKDFEFKKNKIYQKIKIEFERIELFKYFTERKNENILSKDIYIFLQEDFYTIFIVNKIKHKNISHLIEFLNYIISLKFPQDETIEDFSYFCKTFLWLRSNEDTIIGILNIFEEISQVIPNLLSLIKNIINEKVVDYLKEENNEEYKIIINEPFYSLIEAILESILISFSQILKLNEEETQHFFDALKSSIQIIFQIRYYLQIVIRRIFIISQIVRFLESLKLIKQMTFDNLKAYLDFLFNESKFIQENSFDKVKSELINEFEFIKKLFPNNYSSIIIGLYHDKYKQINNTKFRKLLFEIVCEDNSLLIKSKPLFSLLIRYNYELIPKSSYDEIDNYEDDDNEIDDSKEDPKEKEFLCFINKNNDEILNMINKKENIIIDEIFLYLFETKINKFFNTIDKKNNKTEGKENKYEEKLKSLSFKYLKKSINNIEFNDKSKPLAHLGIIYSIAYIKCYLYNYLDIIIHYNELFGSQKIIEDYLFIQSKHKFRNVIRLYLSKLLFNLYYNDFNSFSKEIKNEKYQNWVKEIEGIEKENINQEGIKAFEYLFFDLNSIENYKQISKYFLQDTLKDECLKILKEEPKYLNSFIDLSINKILSFYKYPEHYIDDKINYLKDMLNKLDSQKMENFSKDLLDQETYNDNLKEKIKSLNLDDFIGLLVGFKISLLILFSNKQLFYNKIMGKNCLNELSNNYIPGLDPEINLLISSYYEIKADLERHNNPKYGCYICSCNQFYCIEPCGLPNEIFNCTNCNQKVGGENHTLIEREGHFRIYLNEEQRAFVENKRNFHKFNSMLLKDFKREFIDKEFLNNTKGFSLLLTNEFNDEDKNIRNLNHITYRFLNFILFAILYFNDSVSEEDFKQKIENSKSFLEYLIKDWEIMCKELNKKKIDIKIFIHQIIPQFMDIIQNYEDFSSPEKRTKFENKINIMIINSMNNYQEYFNKYKDENQTLNSISQYEKIIREYNDSLLDEKKFPYFKYFICQRYPNESNLREILKNYPNEEEYPVLKAYLTYKNDERIKNLQNILLINPLENQLLSIFSFNISRGDAKRKTIKDILEIYKLENLFKNFQKGWDNIYKQIFQYKCHTINCKEIDKNSSLAYVLNDDSESDYGMQISGAYYYFTEAQNLFIQSVSPYLNKDNILHFYKKHLESKIIPQNASKAEIVNLDNIKSAEFQSFEEIIYEYSFRNCFKKDNSIDYFNYKEIIYDFDLIEENLGRILLVGKRQFSDEQKFIIYEFEAYHGSNSTILNDFIEKYPQIPLTPEQEKNLINNKGHNSKEFLFSLQMLIFYLNKEGYEKEKVNIKDIIDGSEFPKYINLSDDCKNLFRLFTFGFEHLIEIYNYIEYCSYKEILDNVNKQYKNEIDEKQKEAINDYFNEKPNKKYVIKKIILATAIRKFISRYLSGEINAQDIKPESDLFEVLKVKNDIWDINIYNDSSFEEEIIEMNKKFRLELRHSVNFYAILGGDSNKYHEIPEDKDKHEEEVQNKKKKPKRNPKKWE